jgi:hypothetical protein
MNFTKHPETVSMQCTACVARCHSQTNMCSAEGDVYTTCHLQARRCHEEYMHNKQKTYHTPNQYRKQKNKKQKPYCQHPCCPRSGDVSKLGRLGMSHVLQDMAHIVQSQGPPPIIHAVFHSELSACFTSTAGRSDACESSQASSCGGIEGICSAMRWPTADCTSLSDCQQIPASSRVFPQTGCACRLHPKSLHDVSLSCQRQAPKVLLRLQARL